MTLWLIRPSVKGPSHLGSVRLDYRPSIGRSIDLDGALVGDYVRGCIGHR